MNGGMELRLWLDKASLKRGTLSGRTVVITGGAEGIGKAMVEVFIQLGATVVAVDVEEPSVPAGDWEGVKFIQGDVSKAEDVVALAQVVQREYGAVDILINNAALSPVSPLANTGLDLWDRVMAVNLRGVFLFCRAFLPGMLERQRGTVINMISAEAMPFMTAYITSKQGLVGFSQSLAAELEDSGVRVIAFGPGMVDTPGLNRAMNRLAELSGMEQQQMMAGALPAEQAAVAAACLAVNFAADYHGEVVDAYTVLERAGLFDPASPGAQEERRDTEGGEEGTTGDFGRLPHGALPLCEDFLQVIRETEAEFKRLPVFVRPMAKNRFKGKSGQGLGDWEREVSALMGLLKDVEEGNPESAGLFLKSFPHLRARLDRFVDYCREVPRETARFIKDPAALADITRTMTQREALVCALAAALEQLRDHLSNS